MIIRIGGQVVQQVGIQSIMAPMGPPDPTAGVEAHGWLYNLFHHPVDSIQNAGGAVVDTATDHAADAVFGNISHFLYRLNLDFVGILPELTVTLICLLLMVGMVAGNTGKMLARSAGLYLGGAAWIVLTKSFV